ncbi:hypothetical protein V8C86DRAFT_2630838 [Haematococcus lacustris]
MPPPPNIQSCSSVEADFPGLPPPQARGGALLDMSQAPAPEERPGSSGCSRALRRGVRAPRPSQPSSSRSSRSKQACMARPRRVGDKGSIDMADSSAALRRQYSPASSPASSSSWGVCAAPLSVDGFLDSLCPPRLRLPWRLAWLASCWLAGRGHRLGCRLASKPGSAKTDGRLAFGPSPAGGLELGAHGVAVSRGGPLVAASAVGAAAVGTPAPGPLSPGQEV